MRAALILVLAAPVWAQACDQPAIESYVKTLDATRRALPQRVFGKPFAEDAAWREIRVEFEGITARAWLRDGNPVRVEFGFTSESGDWFLDATYYYRADGTLAKKNELLNTSYGNASVVRDSLYSCAGAVLAKFEKHRDLKTKKERQPEPEFIDQKSPDYKRVQDLPFLRLLTSPGGSRKE